MTIIFYFILQFPQIGELILKRLILAFKKGFRRNQKETCLSSVRFIAHLVNQQVVSIFKKSTKLIHAVCFIVNFFSPLPSVLSILVQLNCFIV